MNIFHTNISYFDKKNVKVNSLTKNQRQKYKAAVSPKAILWRYNCSLSFKWNHEIPLSLCYFNIT